MKIIGVTGPSGAGKSLFSQCLSCPELPTVNADEVYHELLIPPSPCLDAIRREFGDGVFLTDGALDRGALGKTVFSDKQKLELLNRTVLSIVIARIREILEEYRKMGIRAVIVDAPTLIESGFHKECDCVISVLASPDVRINRITLRDGITVEKATERVKAQKCDEFYIENSDHLLYNEEGKEEFSKKAVALAKHLNLL